ncbi:MAG TPA: hypothetical protein VLG50_04055 [Candidatus Saccharimonadales bacterium]|nr:hypothetical protein [Candidatus Saccharimonadales bacterium]
MDFKHFLSVTIGFCIVVYSTNFGMYRVAPTSSWLPSARQAAGYDQGIIQEQLVPMPKASISAEQLRSMQEELREKQQTVPRKSFWQSPDRSFSGLGGIRRFKSSEMYRVPTMTTAEMVTPQRFLLPGQEKIALWVKANNDIDEFRKQWNIPPLSTKDIQEINQIQEAKLKDLIKKFPIDNEDIAVQHRKKVIKKHIAYLLKKHGIDPKDIDIYFVSPEVAEQIGLGNYGVIGNTIIMINEVLQASDDEINTAIEHEISHLVHNDSAYLVQAQISGLLDPVMTNYYLLLLEKRADTHSSIQSKQNVLETIKMSKGVGYATGLKLQHVVQAIKRVAPTIMTNPDFVELGSKPIVDQTIFEIIKRVATQEYKADRISAQALQEVVKECDKQLYMQELLEYMTEQEKHPSCVIAL